MVRTRSHISTIGHNVPKNKHDDEAFNDTLSSTHPDFEPETYLKRLARCGQAKSLGPAYLTLTTIVVHLPMEDGNPRPGLARVGLPTLAALLARSVRCVRVHIRRLEDRRFLAVHGHDAYELLPLAGIVRAEVRP